MTVYGITMGFQIVKTWMGSPEMMECREVQFTIEDARARSEELKRLCESKEPSHDNQ